MPTGLIHKGIPIITVIVFALLVTACGGQPAAPEQGVYDPSVVPLAAEEAAAYLGIVGPGGVLPCGVFNVQGHGGKVVTLANYPACTPHPSLQVACLNGSAQWTTEFVQDVSLSEDTQSVRFTSNQEGLCAVFPPAP